jgi:hypothetical protein
LLTDKLRYDNAVVVLDISDITNPTWRSTFWIPVNYSLYGDAETYHLALLPDGAASISIEYLGPYIVNITTDAPPSLYQGIFRTNSTQNNKELLTLLSDEH